MSDTVSLTKFLVGLDGKDLLVGPDSNQEKINVRSAIRAALIEGSMFAQQKNDLSESEKFNAFCLAREVVNTNGTGYSFKSEEITTIKKFAYLRWPTEYYGALLQELDPAMFKSKKDAAKSD